MNEPEPIKTILFCADLCLVAFCVGLLLIGIYAVLGRLPGPLRSRYPRTITYMSRLPFTEKWRASVSPEDLPLFVRARRRRHVLLLALLLETHLVAAYAYLHVVVDLWRCHMEASGLR